MNQWIKIEIKCVLDKVLKKIEEQNNHFSFIIKLIAVAAWTRPIPL